MTITELRQTIVEAMVQELRRQAEDDCARTPHFDASWPSAAVIDGPVDLEKLAEAIERSLRGEAPHFELGRIWPGAHIGDEATATKVPIAPTPLRLEDV